MTESIAAADFSYVSLRSHALSAVTMPSKVQAALAAGRALVIAADGDLSQVGEECGAAFLARPDDPSDIARALSLACSGGREALAERGRRGRRYCEQAFSVRQGVTRIENLADRCCREEDGGGMSLDGLDAMRGTTVAITGGTGSFGSTMVGHLLGRNVGKVQIFSRTRPSRTTCGGGSPTRGSGSSSATSATTPASPRPSSASPPRLPRRRSQAGAVVRVLPAAGGEDQHPGQPQRHRGRLGRGGAQRCVPEHRQGGVSDQRHGHVQGADGENRPGFRAQPALTDHGVDHPLRQRMYSPARSSPSSSNSFGPAVRSRSLSRG